MLHEQAEPMTEDTAEQIKRLEATVAQLATYLHESRPPKRSMWEHATPIIAILAMGVSALQAWSVTSATTAQRLDLLEKQQQTQAQKVDSWEVPQLKWQMGQVDQRLGRLETTGTANATALSEIRETLIKMGLQITAKK